MVARLAVAHGRVGTVRTYVEAIGVLGGVPSVPTARVRAARARARLGGVVASAAFGVSVAGMSQWAPGL
jgi:hypothetical protein